MLDAYAGFLDRLSQKCKHFFEEMQAAASHFVGAKSTPLILA